MSEENKTLIYAELQSGIVGGYVTDYSQIKNAPTQGVIPVTTQELYEMQISDGLIPNKSYLIYDHVTYIDNQIVPIGINRTSNLIPFDIIVTASSKNTLCEDAIIKSHDYNYESPFSDYCKMLGFSGLYNYDQYSVKGKLVESDFPVMYLFDNGQIFQYFGKQSVTINGKDVYTNIYVDYFFDPEAAQYICIVNGEVYFSHDLLNWKNFPFVIVGGKSYYYDITYMKDDRGNQYTYDAINKLIVENGFIRATFYDYVTDGTSVAQFFNQYAKNNNIDKDVAIYAYHVNYYNNIIKNNFISVGQIQAQQLNINECFEGIFRMESREPIILYNISIYGCSYQTDDLYIPLVSNKQYYLDPETNTLTENNSNNITEVTYDQLLEMAQNFKLTPEAEYLITDYVTTLEEGVFETGHLSNADFSVRNDYLKMDILIKAKDLTSLYLEGKALPIKYKSNFGRKSIREPLDILYDIRNQNSNVIYGIVLDDEKVFYFSLQDGGYIATDKTGFISDKYTIDYFAVGDKVGYVDSEGLKQSGTITDILTPKGAILWMKDMRGNEAPYDFISNSFYIDGLSTLRPGYYYTFTGTDGSNNYNSSLYQNIKIKQDFNLVTLHNSIIPSIFTDYGPQHNINLGYYSHIISTGDLSNVNIYPDTYVLAENCILNNVDILPSDDGDVAHVQEDYKNVLLQASPEGLIIQDKINIKKEQPIIELLSTSSVIEIDNPANFLVGDRVTFKVKQSHRVSKVGDTSRGQYRFKATQEANSVNNGIILKPGQQTTFCIEIPMANPTLGLTVGTIFDTIVEIRDSVLYFVAIGTEFSSYDIANISTNGLMSSSDKTKLDTYPSTYTEVTSYTDTAIANLVDSAPETLNTLNELAVAIQENEDIVKVLNQSIDSKQDTITDLETIRQGATKGATALQSYTEQYKGTVTGVKINGTTKNPSNGVVNLGTVITAHQDISGKQDILVSGTNIKTVNGESLLGKGNIIISGGSNSSGGAYALVEHGTNDTTFILTPNTFHVWDEVANLTLTLGSETPGVANEYLFQFTSGATATTLSLPSDLKWANDYVLTIESNMIYQVSILNGLASVLEFSNVSIISFNINVLNTIYTYNAEEDMTWEQWVYSKYNTEDYQVMNNTIVDRNYSYYVTTDVGSTSLVSLSAVISAEHEYGNYLTGGGGGSN